MHHCAPSRQRRGHDRDDTSRDSMMGYSVVFASGPSVAVAAGCPQAVTAALDCARSGGNLFDAAVAGAAVQCVAWVCTIAPSSGRATRMSRWKRHSDDGLQGPRQFSASPSGTAQIISGVISS